MQDAHDLNLVLQSKVPLIIIESFEENRVLDLLTRVSIKNTRTMSVWSITDGLRPLGYSATSNDEAIIEPEEALEHIKRCQNPATFILCDIHPFLTESHPRVIRLLKDIALAYNDLPRKIILLSHAIQIPPELKRFCAHFELSLPSDEQILTIIREEATRWSRENRNARVKTDNITLQKIVNNLKGLTHGDVRMLARGLISDDGAILDNDIPEINKAKFQLMDMEGVLSFEYDTEHFSNVGGLKNLKEWLEKRRKVFINDEDSNGALDAPKGILLLGVQGGGKSLAAKAVAGMWGLPLLRLDTAALYNKYIGETEKNLREVIKLADLMAPCVLWLDEIEKGLAKQDNDGGTSQRILGTLLTWMAERKSKVFIVATSNDISGLPPELIRKGRLDEIFFVDLPDNEVRKHIFEIHCEKRHINPDSLDLQLLADMSEGFSGAEIEQTIVSALYRSDAQEEAISTQHICDEINDTSPISVVMAEKIQQLRLWANERTISAN